MRRGTEERQSVPLQNVNTGIRGALSGQNLRLHRCVSVGETRWPAPIGRRSPAVLPIWHRTRAAWRPLDSQSPEPPVRKGACLRKLFRLALLEGISGHLDPHAVLLLRLLVDAHVGD